ncbi:MAG: hypothetical protein WKG07_41000 [Hymenobacter sp.]
MMQMLPAGSAYGGMTDFSSFAALLERDAAAREGWLLPLLGLAVGMIALALLLAAFFTLRRTRREGLRSLWTAPARRLLAALGRAAGGGRAVLPETIPERRGGAGGAGPAAVLRPGPAQRQ